MAVLFASLLVLATTALLLQRRWQRAPDRPETDTLTAAEPAGEVAAAAEPTPSPGPDDERRALTAEIGRLRRAQSDLQESEAFSRAVFEASQTGLLVVATRTGQIMDANGAAAEILGWRSGELAGEAASMVLPDVDCALIGTSAGWNIQQESTVRTADLRIVPVIRSLRGVAGRWEELVVVSFVDISQQKTAEAEIRESHKRLELANEELQRHKDQIVQSEKLASIGQLAAGVAHEINNPIGFVTSNLGTVQDYLTSLQTILRMYEELDAIGDERPTERAAQAAAIAAAKAEEDLEFIFGDLANVVQESLDGVGRVAEIVQNLKSFARADVDQTSAYDVNEGVEAMVRMSWNELKYRCEVVREFGEIPTLACNAGRINQVIMNMLVNAAQAMPEQGGKITLRTAVVADEAVITIADTGAGIAPEHLSRIFDPFFTTKEVGSGTGLGLSISHGIIQEHGGRIEVASQPGSGTTFRICLPLSPVTASDIIG